MRKKVLCIQGPTASGKSSLADAMAVELSGEIVSADSMQIYRHMDIGTAKVMPAQRSVRYHCLDILEPGQTYSAALFQKDARRAIDDIYEREKTPIICGGTGLYVRAALDDMQFAAGEQRGNEVRERYAELARTEGPQAVYAELERVDAASAAVIHPNNVRRVIRALEMHEMGESYAQRKGAFKTVRAAYPRVKIALDVSRDVLYERINERVEAMVREGLVEEVASLLDRGYRDGATSAQAIGYKEIVDYLDGVCTLDDAIAQIKLSTRRYAKRQMTWLRSDDEIIWLDATAINGDELVERALNVYSESSENDTTGGLS